jgi:NADH:ubiquinone oxidoreductase subunit 5 (subunit L)/multisubunit Na+/H+ antiporter MnhA subunit
MLLENDILLALIVILPFTAAAIIPALGKLGGKAVAGFAVIAAIILAVLVFLLVPDIFFDNVAPIGLGDGIQYDWIPSAGIIFGFHIDPLSLTLAIVASAIGALAVIYSLKYMDGKKGLPRYYSLVLLFIGSMVCLVFTNNLLILYLFWEVIGLCSYGLIGFYNQDPKAAKAGIKAFVVTRVGDIGLLIGIFILYLGTGTFNIQEIIASPPTMQCAGRIPVHTGRHGQVRPGAVARMAARRDGSPHDRKRAHTRRNARELGHLHTGQDVPHILPGRWMGHDALDYRRCHRFAGRHHGLCRA